MKNQLFKYYVVFDWQTTFDSGKGAYFVETSEPMTTRKCVEDTTKFLKEQVELKQSKKNPSILITNWKGLD